MKGIKQSRQAETMPTAIIKEVLYIYESKKEHSWYHGNTVLLQRSGADDSSQQTAVSDGVLLAFESLVQQLTVDQQQLTPQRLKLLPLGGA